MDKTLDTLIQAHRFIMAVALALIIVGASTKSPNNIYDDAETELSALQTAIQEASSQVSNAYEAIYEKSQLKASIIAWLKRHNVAQEHINIKVISSNDIAVPDAANPLVTLETQVKWADRVYREFYNPLTLCSVDHSKVITALDRIFDTMLQPIISQVTVYVWASGDHTTGNRLQCEVELQYEVHIGAIKGLQTVKLSVRTSAIEVIGVEPWIDLEIAHALKGNGLGDFEDSYAVLIPSLRELWADVGNLPPSAVSALLKHKKAEEIEKSKKKIEVLGQSLNSNLTIILASVIELSLMIYLLARLMQIEILMPGHEITIFESPFFGIMHSWLGRLIMFSTLLVIPLGGCTYAMISTLPSLQREWLWPQLEVEAANVIGRFMLTTSIGVIGLILCRRVYCIIDQLPTPSHQTSRLFIPLVPLSRPVGLKKSFVDKFKRLLRP